MSRRIWFWILLALFVPHVAFAAISLPLDGYCKPGRYFPILIDGSDASHRHKLTGEGCLSVEVAGAATSRLTVPMLAVSEPRSIENLPLRVPAENERLVGTTTGPIDQLASLFPNCRLIPIRLDTAELMPGPPVAWEALDAVVLDAAQFDRIPDAQRSALLAGGVVLVAVGDRAPDTRWPWRRSGQLWVLKNLPLGPGNDVVNEAVYAPTYAWSPGWSPAIRGQVMGIGILIVLCTLGLLILKVRWAPLFVVGLCILSAIGIAMWRNSLGFVDRAGGDIAVIGKGLVQRDSWMFARAKKTCDQSIAWTGSTHPVFSSASVIEQACFVVTVSATGELGFKYHAIEGHTMAFFHRQIQPGNGPVPTSILGPSPMEEAVKAAYLGFGDRIIGDEPPAAGRWPGVIVQAATQPISP